VAARLARKLDPAKSLPYRPYHSHDERLWLKPGEAVECQVEVWATSMVFKKGHRIRVDVQPRDGVGSAPYTHYHADYNRGAQNTIYFRGDKPSWLMLPIHSREVGEAAKANGARCAPVSRFLRPRQASGSAAAAQAATGQPAHAALRTTIDEAACRRISEFAHGRLDRRLGRRAVLLDRFGREDASISNESAAAPCGIICASPA